MSDLLADNAHIPSAEIEQDILETEREIANMEQEAEWLASTPENSREYRWNNMRASARKSGIAERKEFIGKLRKILELRQAAQ